MFYSHRKRNIRCICVSRSEAINQAQIATRVLICRLKLLNGSVPRRGFCDRRLARQVTLASKYVRNRKSQRWWWREERHFHQECLIFLPFLSFALVMKGWKNALSGRTVDRNTVLLDVHKQFCPYVCVCTTNQSPDLKPTMSQISVFSIYQLTSAVLDI